MGRNRDDILFGSLRTFLREHNILGVDIDSVTLIGIPSASKWTIEGLVEKIKASSSPYILILASEGAKPSDLWYPAVQAQSVIDGIGKLIPLMCGRKINTHTVGYLAQTNIADGDRDVALWSSVLSRVINADSDDRSPVAIVKRNGMFEAVDLESIIKLNPDSSGIIPISDADRDELGRFLI